MDELYGYPLDGADRGLDDALADALGIDPTDLPAPHTSHNPLQGGAHWLNQRCGFFTASRAALATERNKPKVKGEQGPRSAKALDYMKAIVAERMTGVSVQSFVTKEMQWGIDCEPEAREAYQIHTGFDVRLAAFIPHRLIPFFGASPDGLVGADGLVEIKNPTTVTFVEWRQAGVVPEEHQPQMLAQLACTGRKWVDFWAYDAWMKNPAHRHFLRRFQPDPIEVAALEAAVSDFLAATDALFEAVTRA